MYFLRAKRPCTDKRCCIEAQFKSAHTDRDLYPEIDNVLEQCLKQYPEVGASPVPGSEDFDILETLKSSNLELKKLATSKAPELRYGRDFALSEKAKKAAAERAAKLAEAKHSSIQSRVHEDFNSFNGRARVRHFFTG